MKMHKSTTILLNVVLCVAILLLLKGLVSSPQRVFADAGYQSDLDRLAIRITREHDDLEARLRLIEDICESCFKRILERLPDDKAVQQELTKIQKTLVSVESTIKKDLQLRRSIKRIPDIP